MWSSEEAVIVANDGWWTVVQEEDWYWPGVGRRTVMVRHLVDMTYEPNAARESAGLLGGADKPNTGVADCGELVCWADFKVAPQADCPGCEAGLRRRGFGRMDNGLGSAWRGRKE
jgi:hypothetical protein